MKKFFISAFLVVSLFAVSIVPAFAVVGVDDAAVAGLIIEATVAVKNEYIRWRDGLSSSATFQKQLEIYKSLWGTPSATSATCTISYEALCELCTDLNQSQSCRLFYNSSLGGYVIRAQSEYTCYYKGTREIIWNNTYKTLRNSAGQYYVAPYNTDSLLNQIENAVDGLEGYTDDIETILNKIEARFTYTTGGVAYSIASRCYLINQKLEALDSLESIQTTLSYINSHFTYTTGGTSYSIANRCYYIGRRLDDVITALGNQSVNVNLRDLDLTLDTSHIDISANTSYCIISLTDPSGTDYDYTVIPYDTAVSMLSRLNTDYIGDTINQLSTDGQSTYSRSVLDANLTEDGFIMVNTTNGRHYYLCNSSRMIYHIDPTTNYCLAMSQSIDTQSAAILEKLDVINESINDIDIEAEVIQNIQQYDTDVDDGVSVISKILHLVRGFFNPGISVEWNDARGYAMNWGNDS